MKKILTENDAEDAVAVIQMMLAAAVRRQAEEDGSAKQAVHEQIARRLQGRGVKVSAATVRRFCTSPTEELVGVQLATAVAMAGVVGLRVKVELEDEDDGTQDTGEG